VTVPLAIAFKIFGFSATVARAYMVVWMIVMIVAVFLFTKKYFGELEAGLASVLVSSFASFYGTGRSVMGEIPGFTFLLLGIHMWLSKKYYWSGFFVITRFGSS
jgi:4-amino-4-deoxy-L-arabinose transferase-like glycosyltransferase